MSHDSLNTVTAIHKPTVAPALGFLFVIVSLGLSWAAMAYALRSLEDVWQDRVEALAEIHETTSPFYRMLPSLSEVGHPVAVDSAVIELSAARARSSKAWRSYLQTTLTEAEVALMNQTTAPVASLLAGADSLVSALKSGNHDTYVRVMNELFIPRLAAVAQRMEALVALQQTVTRERVAEAKRRFQMSRAVLIGSGLLAVALLMVGAGVVKRRGVA